MTVAVKTPAGELLQIEIDRHAPAAQLSVEIERQTGISMTEYTILYQDKWPVRPQLEKCNCSQTTDSGYRFCLSQIYPLLSLTDQAVLDCSTLELCHRSTLLEEGKRESQDRRGT